MIPARASDKPHGQSAAILVTGGSGFIGRHLVKKLADLQETVVSMYHHRLPEPMANVYPVCSDMSSAELIAAPLRGVHTVVHLAWAGNFIGPKEDLDWGFKTTSLPNNIKILNNLIQAMEKAGTRRIVFVSAIGASRKAQTPFLKEKYLAEFLVLNSKIPEKIILRTSIICDDGGADRFVKSMRRVMQYPAIYPVPQSKSVIAPLNVDDVAEALVRVTRTDLPEPCSVVEFSGSESYRVDELFKLVSERFAVSAKLPIKGILGDSLLSFFERDAKRDLETPRLRYFLAIGSQKDTDFSTANPLMDILPSTTQSFKDRLAQPPH